MKNFICDLINIPDCRLTVEKANTLHTEIYISVYDGNGHYYGLVSYHSIYGIVVKQIYRYKDDTRLMKIAQFISLITGANVQH